MWSHLKDNSQTLLVLIPTAIIIVGLLWRTVKRYPSIIIMQSTEGNKFLINECSSFAEYRPTPWIFNGHLMTILGACFRLSPQMSFERVVLNVDNTGGTIALDWHTRPYYCQPILLILPGLTGGSHDAYIRYMVLYASSKLDLCCVVIHARGCGRTKLTSSKLLCAANTDDIRTSLKYIRSIVGNKTPVFAVGYSLGAGILAKFLGEEDFQCSMQGAIICCASFDMHLTSNNLERGLNLRVYNRRLAANLIRYLQQHEEHFSQANSQLWLNVNDAYRSKTVRDFDKHIIVPMHGFRDVDHYYTEASPNKWLEYIRVSTLIVSAIDDPICPVGGLPSDIDLKNSHIIAIKTLEGGHVSYLQGWWPKSFSYDNVVVVDYIKARLKQINYQREKHTDKISTIDVSISRQL